MRPFSNIGFPMPLLHCSVLPLFRYSILTDFVISSIRFGGLEVVIIYNEARER